MDTATRDKVLGEVQFREVTFSREAVNVEARTVGLSFSSDTPYARWWGIEILSHEPGDVKMGRLSDGAALLLNHNTSDQIGVVERCSIDPDKIGRAVVRFSKSERGEEIFRDVQDGIRRKTSVGYMVHSMEEMKPEDMDDDLKNMCAGEGLKAYRCKWEPYEISMVSVPADVGVGVGRSQEVVTPSPAKGEETTTINMRGAKMEQEKTTPSPEEMAKIQADAMKADRERIASITALAEKYSGRIPNVATLRDQAIKDGVDAAAFKGQLFDALPNDGKPFETPRGSIGMNEKEIKRYDLTRALRAISGEKVDAGFEMECSRQVQSQFPERPSRQGAFFLPFDLADLNRRDLSYAGGATAGANLVGTELRPSEWLDMLRNKSVASQIGVRRVTFSGGNVTFPRQTGAATAYWPGEASAFTESNLTFGLVTATPNEVGTYIDVSRRLLQQGTPSVEGIVRNDLIQTVMISEETQLFSGAGTNYPTGIINTSGVGTVTAGGINWAAAVEFETDIQTANADVSNMWYVFNAAGGGILKTRAKESGYPIYLMGDDRRMNGYGVAISNMVASGYGYFGDWNKALLCTWGMIEILNDPYAQATSGLVRFHVFHLMDVAILQPSAFTYCSDLS